MARLGSWIESHPEGIYVRPADAWIDPSQPKARAWVTHGHADHMGGMDYLMRVNPNVKIYAPKEGFGIFGAASLKTAMLWWRKRQLERLAIALRMRTRDFPGTMHELRIPNLRGEQERELLQERLERLLALPVQIVVAGKSHPVYCQVSNRCHIQPAPKCFRSGSDRGRR